MQFGQCAGPYISSDIRWWTYCSALSLLRCISFGIWQCVGPTVRMNWNWIRKFCFTYGCSVTYHRRHRQYTRHESMDTMFYPDDCDACPFICIFTFETESYGRSTQIAVIFLYAFRDATVESCIGDGNILFILVLGHHLHNYISMRSEKIEINEPKKVGNLWESYLYFTRTIFPLNFCWQTIQSNQRMCSVSLTAVTTNGRICWIVTLNIFSTAQYSAICS